MPTDTSEYVFADLDSDGNPRPVLLSTGGTGGEGDVSITITSTNSFVQEGEDLEVNFDATNNSSNATTATLTLSRDSKQISSRNETFGGGETKSLTMTWGTSTGDAGIYTVRVASGTDSDTAEVRVEVAPRGEGDFDVTITSTNSLTEPGDQLQVGFDVTNNLSQQQDGEVVLTIDGARQDALAISLDADETVSYTFVWDTTQDTATGDYLACVSSGTDVDCATATVPEPDTHIVNSTISADNPQGVSTYTYSEVATVNNVRFIRFSASHSPNGQVEARDSAISLGFGQDAGSPGHPRTRFVWVTNDALNLTGYQENELSFSSGTSVDDVTVDLGQEYSGTIYVGAEDGTSTVSPP